ncbi:MAG: AMP-binding protein, partial [Acidobacteria bacterium]|nr:AMP-binding protein [Acidobacteriota bacterium]
LLEHPTVARAVVVARGESASERHLVAYCVPREGAELDTDGVRGMLAAALPGYMVPSVFVPLASIPLTPNGKIDLRSLPSDAGVRRGVTAAIPRTPTEEMVAGIWREVLRTETIGAQDNFFDIGGHSLLAMQVTSRIRQASGVELPVRSLFESPTIATLAARIDALRGGVASRSSVPLRRAARAERRVELDAAGAPLANTSQPPMTTGYVFPLSATQQRLWLLQQIEPASAAYHLAGAVELVGPLSVEALGRALNAVVERHEALRSAFFLRDGEPVQVVVESVEVPLPLSVVAEPDAESPDVLRRLLAAEVEKPFDLTRAPCLRASLFRLGPERHVFSVVVHHLLADGWSLGVMVREIGACYDAFANGGVPELVPLPIQYGDFAIWQQETLAGDGVAADLEYWTRRLAGPVPPLELPADRLRPTRERHHGDRLAFTIDASLHDAIRRLARGEDATPFMVALAGFEVLLSRYSGQTDFGIGTPVAGRGRPELEGLVGFFVNTLVLRSDLSDNPTFRQLLGRVRETTLSAFEHQEVPFEKVVEALHVTRDPGRNPLFQVMLAFQPPDLALPRLDGLEVRPVELDRRAAQFDLTLFLQERGDGIAGWIEYSTDLFDRETIERLALHFNQLLSAVSLDPDVPVGSVDVRSETEVTQVAAWNATAAPVPACGVHELVEAQAARTPEAVAVVDETGSLTYAALDARATGIARRLRAAGVGRGARVGVCVERSAAMVAAILGVAKSGAAYVPLDPSFPEERLAYMLEDAGVRALVVDARTRETLGAPEGVPRVDLDGEAPAWTAEDGAGLPPIAGPADLAYLIYTSGSTGRPKGVEVPHRALVNFLASMQREPGLGADDVLVAVTTLSFDIAALELWLPLVVGAKVVVASRETAVDGLALARLLESAGATVLQATPATWRLLLE